MRNDIFKKNTLIFIISIGICFSCNSIGHEQDLYLNNNGLLLSRSKLYIVNNKVDNFLNYEKQCSDQLEMEEGIFESSSDFIECTYFKSEKKLFRISEENGRVTKIIIVDESIKVRNLLNTDISIGNKLSYLFKAGNYDINFTESFGSYIQLKSYPNITFYTDCEPYMDLQNGKFNYSKMKNCLITEISSTLY